MGTQTLLHLGNTREQLASFQFDHAQSHRKIWGAMAPLDRFSAIPYWVDPQLEKPPWYRDHQQAHDDFTTTLPVWFQWDVFGTIAPPQNMLDNKLSNPGQRSWWLFANQLQHYTAESVLPTELTFPFW